MKRALVGAAVAVMVSLLGGLPATAAPSPDGDVTTSVRLRLERSGALSVTERVAVPPGRTVHRTIALRRPVSADAARVFTVEDVHVRGNGSATVTEDAVALALRPGVSTVTYSVTGAVAERPDHEQVRWRVSGGWDVPVARVEVSFIAPRPAQSIHCRAGAAGTDSKCDQFQITRAQAARATHFDLRPGQRVRLSLEIPPGTVPANARFDRAFSLAGAFALTPVSGAGLAAVGLLLIGGFGLLWYWRGRDVRVLAGEVGPVEVLLRQPDGVSFASPDGVLPGQVGTVIDEYVDVVDVTSTIVDLAVRNYLWIEELPGEHQSRDWRIVGVNPPDESLRPYERAVHELLFGDQREADAHEEVLVSDLRAAGKLDLAPVRDDLYSDVVDKGWFSRRPDTERNLFWWVGIGLSAVGAALTVVLALTTSLGLVGVGVVVGGVGFTLGARLMPARAKRGSFLVAQMRGLRDYLHTAEAEAVPVADREMVFSRSLPYAVVLGETERWLGEFAELDPAADGTPGLYWYGELVEDTGHVVPNLRRFRAHFPMLISALDSALSQPGHLRPAP